MRQPVRLIHKKHPSTGLVDLLLRLRGRLADVPRYQLIPLHLHQQIALRDAYALEQRRHDAPHGRFPRPGVPLEDHVVLAARVFHVEACSLPLLVQTNRLVELVDLVLQPVEPDDVLQLELEPVVRAAGEDP